MCGMWLVFNLQNTTHSYTHTHAIAVGLFAYLRARPFGVSLFALHLFFFLLFSQSIFVLLWFLAVCSLIVLVFVYFIVFFGALLTATPSFLNNFKCYELLEKVIKKLQRLRVSHSLSRGVSSRAACSHEQQWQHATKLYSLCRDTCTMYIINLCQSTTTYGSVCVCVYTLAIAVVCVGVLPSI